MSCVIMNITYLVLGSAFGEFAGSVGRLPATHTDTLYNILNKRKEAELL